MTNICTCKHPIALHDSEQAAKIDPELGQVIVPDTKDVIDEKSTNRLILENPTWKSHETDRTKSIFRTLKEYHANKSITTPDPRIAMSIVLKGRLENQDVELQNPVCLTKIFPRFWECLNN